MEFDYNSLVLVTTYFVVLAALVERSLYQLFDMKLYKSLEKKVDDQMGGDFMDLKPLISTIFSIAVVYKIDVDIYAILFGAESSNLTLILTGLFISGGSTGVYKFLKKIRNGKKVKGNKNET